MLTEIPLGIGYLLSNSNRMEDLNLAYTTEASKLNRADLICLSSNALGTREAIDILRASRPPVAIGGQVTMWNR